MPRPPRLNAHGTFHHVITRGNNRGDIFFDVGDRLQFLTLLETSVFEFDWRCHAYCLMGNHYHLLIETPEGMLAEGMHLLNGTFARRSNRKHGHVGHVFERRYWSELVADESQLKQTARYIVNNPVRCGWVPRAADYLWSSHLAMLGLRTPHGCLTTAWLLRQFGRGGVARERYGRFVDAAIEADELAGARHVPGTRGYASASSSRR